MKFSYNWLQDYLEQKLPPAKKLANLLTMHSFEVEHIRRRGRDFIFDIDILPDRAHDCLSYIGVAREIATLTGSKLRLPHHQMKEKRSLLAKNFVKVIVNNKQDCPRYAARVISGLKIKSSPKWLQTKLKSCGLQPINNVVDITNYVMLETGQPIHAFDLARISPVNKGNQKSRIKTITVKRALRGEKIKVFDGKEYLLNEGILVIADEKGAIAIAGIKGGKRTGINKQTKNVVIETANFNSHLIRKSSRALKLKTDASWRFENDLDPNLIDFAQARVSSLVKEIAGGEITRGLIDYYPKKAIPKKVFLDLDYLQNLLGIKVGIMQVKIILRRLGFRILRSKNSVLEIEIPTRRLDVSLPEDLIEEVGRILGYQKIPLVFPRVDLRMPQRNDDIFWEDFIKNLLRRLVFDEVYNYSFLGEKTVDFFGYKREQLLSLENPMSDNQRYLRPSLLPGLVMNIKKNLNLSKTLKIFEFGKIFSKSGISERKMIAGIFTKDNFEKEGFYELKGIIDTILKELGISENWYDDFHLRPITLNANLWDLSKCAEIKIGKEKVGVLGAVNPEIMKNVGIANQVFGFEVNFEILKKVASEEQEYEPISSYPAAVRDLAILVPRPTKVVQVLNIINRVGGKIVRDIDLFDIYFGKGIEGGKENLAFHIVYQARDHTLTSQEIDKLHQKIIRALELNQDWKVRK